MSDTPPWPEGSLDAVLGFETIEATPELARARAEVRSQHKQPFGLVHGGVYAAMAESLASQATYVVVSEEGNMAMGQANNTQFMRPIFSGTIHAEARRRHRGSTTWIWDVDMSDDEGRVCAISRVTIAVRPAPPER